MYIAPNSNIKILQNVPLEKDYINTLYFAGVTSQYNYFLTKVKYNLLTQSYQRVNKGVCRVNYKAEDLYDCNYMMFQNTSFGTKWFYAFIDRIEYINNVTSDIYYTIDVMQTWLSEMVLTRCFVEREHSETDVIGENVVAEPLDTGEFVFNYYEKLWADLDEMGIMIVISDTQLSTDGNLVNGIYSGAQYRVFPNTEAGAAGVNAFIDRYLQQPDAILSIYLVPYPALFSAPSDEGYWLTDEDHVRDYSPEHKMPETAERDKFQLSEHDTLDGYLPRNKKLYTYPFNFFHVDNANGRELNLRFEYFNDDNGYKNYMPQFMLSCNPVMPVTCVLRPYNYKGIYQGNDGSGDVTSDQTCCSESIDLTSYPMCSWNVDSWNAWVAQNSVPESISILSKGITTGMTIGAGVAGIGTGGASAVAGAIVGATASGISMASDIVSRRYTASIQADVCKGSLNNANVNVSCHNKKQNFFCGRLSVNRHMAHIIDDFFDRYGYATNRVKIPNTHSRPQWNYVKTITSNVGGNIPADDKKIIDNIFNNGITFWKNPANVDNYSLDNSPT